MTKQAGLTQHIDADTLRQWLDTHRPVTVLDVRADADRAQWAIPGSAHVNAYDALRDGKPGALSTVDLPKDRPIVTVCNAGRVSQTAATILTERGLDVRSLEGGMKAWSLAWNTASVPLPKTTVRVVQVRRTGKGCLSYIVGSDHEAAVIDPSVSSDVYTSVAAEYGWSIRFVLETHVHADHLSRASDLFRRTGAALLLPRQNRITFPFTPVSDRDRISIGGTTITALHTPGHTAESTAFLLNASAFFSGDTLFTNGVGRPDLHADPVAARERAALLFASLVRLRRLSPNVMVLPAHASEPIAFDAQAVAASFGEQATGVDASSAYVETARQEADRLGRESHVRFLHADSCLLQTIFRSRQSSLLTVSCAAIQRTSRSWLQRFDTPTVVSPSPIRETPGTCASE
jgi:glyoxylase-like metal-dependent hydrolase (beta-lactamase superfamily II)/rhodanese-related sulfurtransferase